MNNIYDLLLFSYAAIQWVIIDCNNICQNLGIGDKIQSIYNN